MDILIDDEGQSPFRESILHWSRQVLAAEGLPDTTEIGILLTDADRIRELNAEHRGIDSPTDVLSFPMYDSKEDALEDAAELQPEEPLLIGDMALCVEVAAENAEEDGHPVEDELRLLVVHGILHLLGHDHVGDSDDERERARVMEARQSELISILAEG